MAGHGWARKGPCIEIENSPHFRSAWERNVYRALKLNKGLCILYEPHRFKFEKPYRRQLDYLPDFICGVGCFDPVLEIQNCQIIEIKGWLDGPSKTKLLGFKKYFPEQFKKLIVVTTGRGNLDWVRRKLGCEVWDYAQMKRELAGLIPWE